MTGNSVLTIRIRARRLLSNIFCADAYTFEFPNYIHNPCKNSNVAYYLQINKMHLRSDTLT